MILYDKGKLSGVSIFFLCLILVFLGICIGAIIYLLLDPHYDVLGLMMAVFFTPLLLLAVFGCTRVLDVYDDRIVSRYLIGGFHFEAHRKDITCYAYVDKQHITCIMIRTPTRDLALAAVTINETALQERLQAWGVPCDPRVKYKEYTRPQKQLVAGILVFAALFVGSVVGVENMTVAAAGRYTERHDITGNLGDIPVEQKPGKDQPGYIKMTLQQYPGFDFYLDETAYGPTIQSQLERAVTGTAVTLSVSQHVYKVKLHPSVIATFLERHRSWERIKVYAATVDSLPALTIKPVVQVLKQRNFPGWARYLLEAALGGLAGLLFLFIRRRNHAKRTAADPYNQFSKN